MPNTADAATELLDMLSDDELARYRQIACDQASAELRRWWVQALLALGAVGSLVWAWVRWSAVGVDGDCVLRCVGSTLGLALVLGYWPWRRARNWSLWHRHVKAVDAEQARRRHNEADHGGATERMAGERVGGGDNG